MHCVRAADDFDVIRARLAELRGERARPGDAVSPAEPPVQLPDAVAHVPSHVIERLLARARRSSMR
ncbi:MAG TPA: hypothetical protein VMI30_10055 [Stellaceae bacterium]|nr:hypothetical protein [Stellaceae bacterium]